MAVSFEQFARELRAFDGRRVILKELRREVREPLPEFRRDVKKYARANLPAGGGLGAWVAALRITMSVRDRGRTAGIRLKGSRKSTKNLADLKRLDGQGRLRHPLYGNRGHWYQQQVEPGFWTIPFTGIGWVDRADRALDRALEVIRRG